MSKFTDDRESMIRSGALGLVTRGGAWTGSFGPRAQVPGTPSSTSPHHNGGDIGAPIGSPLFALGDYRVRYAYKMKDGALDLFLGDANDGWRYVHNNRHHVVAGQYVRFGSHIADVGMTGNVNGPHVHLERYVGGRPVDPVPYLVKLAESLRPATPKPTPVPPVAVEDEEDMVIWWSNENQRGIVIVADRAVVIEDDASRKNIQNARGTVTVKVSDNMLNNLLAKAGKL